jgi:hypothetical protein
VSSVESQLRDLLDAAVGDPPRRVTVERVRCRVARRRKLECVTSAVVVVVLLALGMAASAAGPSRNSAADAGLRARVPRYYVTVQDGPKTLVRSTATGAVTGTVPTPSVTEEGCSIAAADHQVFFMACAVKRDPVTLYEAVRIYRFQITATGRVTGYTRIPCRDLRGAFEILSFAASADGSEVAVGLALTAAPFGGKIVVINTATGARAVWHSRPAAGKVSLAILSDELSFARDGRELVTAVLPYCDDGKVRVPPCHPASGAEVLALSPANRGGDLNSARVLLQQSWFMRPYAGSILGALVSPDGTTLTLVVQHYSTRQKPAIGSVVQYSAVTGRQLRVLYRGRGMFVSLRDGDNCLGADASGRYFLLNTRDFGRGVNGWIDHGRLVRLPPAAGVLWYQAW